MKNIILIILTVQTLLALAQNPDTLWQHNFSSSDRFFEYSKNNTLAHYGPANRSMVVELSSPWQPTGSIELILNNTNLNDFDSVITTYNLYKVHSSYDLDLQNEEISFTYNDEMGGYNTTIYIEEQITVNNISSIQTTSDVFDFLVELNSNNIKNDSTLTILNITNGSLILDASGPLGGTTGPSTEYFGEGFCNINYPNEPEYSDCINSSTPPPMNAQISISNLKIVGYKNDITTSIYTANRFENKTIIKRIDLNGREISTPYLGQPYIIIYSDGTREKSFQTY